MIRIELTVLLKPNVKYKNETDPTQIPIDTQYDKLAAIMSALKVRVVKCETEGVKRLAYKIKGFNCAIYTFYELGIRGRCGLFPNGSRCY